MHKLEMKLVVMIPAHNEEKTIGEVIKDIPREIKGIERVEVLVVEDGSTDRTFMVAEDAGADVIINSKEKIGLAKTFKKGLDAALEMDADIIVNIDADNQYDPKEIPKLIKPIVEGDAEIVLGSRFSGTIEHMPAQKRIGNRIATFITRRLSGLPISDAQTGFRSLSRDAALRLNILSKFTYTQETIIQASFKGMKVIEVPVKFRRRDGRSRLISNIFSYAKNAGATIITTYLNYKPLKVFLGIGGFLMLLGLLIGSRVFIHFIITGQVSPYLPSAVLTAILMIVGFQVVTIGLFAEMVKSNRELIEDALYTLRKK
jgi:glycosyltransferase involved in cell wall biosynthesis